VSRKVAAEHRGLDALFAEMRVVLTGAMARVRETFGRLRAAVETHFALEDQLYYPAIWVLRPEHKASLGDLVQAHTVFLDTLADIAAQLERGALEEAERTFAVFAESFVRHEEREEELLRGVEREWAASA
jgi:hypothetical protein